MNSVLTRQQLYIIIAAGIIMTVVMGVRQTFGLFLVPMTIDLDWSRGLFGLAMALQNLIWGALQPFVGGIADRYGAAKVIATGAIVYAIGILGMANAVTPTELILTGGVLVGIGMSGAGIAVIFGAVSRAVSAENRTYAVAIVSTIGSLGPMLLPVMSQTLIGISGWSFSLMISAIIVLLMILLVRLLRNDQQNIDQESELNVKEVLREASQNSGYILLLCGFFVCGFQVTLITTHFPGYITSEGLSYEAGAVALTIIGFANVIGTYLAGETSKKFRQKHILSLIYLGRGILIIAMLLLPASPWSIYVVSAVLGFLWLATVPLTSGVVSRIFGAKHLGMLFGIVFFSHQVGGFFGAWLGGEIFDLTGSYDIAWYAAIILSFTAAFLHWPIKDLPANKFLSTSVEQKSVT
ncbi:MAG: MFS transporter [Alphaproteobacteria bacterium]|nr:MFS transporter [Alphaproteobacteria bacterium]